ncbi:hypothetical protein [Hydrocarboniphaga sp.]|uniref:hypothetical protein n=1 Tax=Hydrocarboniphaga sp. TaxID=2033016 RepID=UPI003D124303
MKRLFPTLSSLFATWTTAGQYSSVEQLELAEDEAESTARKVHPLPGVQRRPADSVQAKPPRKKFG